MKKCFAAFVLLMCVGVVHAQQNPTVLYDGAFGTRPTDQNWLYFATGGTETAPTLPTQPFTTLDTMAGNGFQAGYTPLTSLILNRSVGFGVQFDVRVASETHVNNNRAGFSAIVLSSDKKGIELGFWQNEVWAQNSGIAAEDGQIGTSLFTHGEGAVFDTAATITRYDLRVLNDSYRLFANDTQILSGNLRDYTAFNGFPDPYETSNYLFLGDNTTSARARFDFRYAGVNTPEVGTLCLFFVSLPLLCLLQLNLSSRTRHRVAPYCGILLHLFGDTRIFPHDRASGMNLASNKSCQNCQ